MKHIQKRYLFQVELDNRIDATFNSLGTQLSLDDKDLLKKSKNKDLYVRTDLDIVFKAFAFNYNGQTAIIPIPDLTLVYFDAAYNYNNVRKGLEKVLFDRLLVNREINEDATKEVYSYFGNACSCIILLFTSLECFINHIIPDNREYGKKIENKRTEIYTKEQIIRYIDFNEKMKEVIPSIFNKNFFQKQTASNQHIDNLKQIRDEIVHTKSSKNYIAQEELIKKVLKFKYENTFEAVTSFINFYRPDYITECKCGVDF